MYIITSQQIRVRHDDLLSLIQRLLQSFVSTDEIKYDYGPSHVVFRKTFEVFQHGYTGLHVRLCNVNSCQTSLLPEYWDRATYLHL